MYVLHVHVLVALAVQRERAARAAHARHNSTVLQGATPVGVACVGGASAAFLFKRIKCL